MPSPVLLRQNASSCHRFHSAPSSAPHCLDSGNFN